jgi:hypothetical protein
MRPTTFPTFPTFLTFPSNSPAITTLDQSATSGTKFCSPFGGRT